MNILLSTIANVGAVFCLLPGFLALRQNSKKPINRMFFFLSIMLAGFIFWTNIVYDSANSEQLVALYFISHFFFCPFFAVNLHFHFVFTKHKLKLWQLILLYLPAAVSIILKLTDNSLYTDFAFEHGKWNFTPGYHSPGFYFYIIYSVSYTAVSAIIINNYRKRSGLKKDKRWASIICAAYITSLLFGFTLSFMLPYSGISNFARLGTSAYILYLLAIFYSVFRYKFLNLVPLVLVDDIVSHISEIFILLNTDLTIAKINKICAETLGLDHAKKRDIRKKISGKINSSAQKGNILSEAYFEEYQDLKAKHTDEITRVAEGLDIKKLIIDDGIILKKINEIITGDIYYFNWKILFKGKHENIVTDSYVTKIIDKFGDFIAVLIIAKLNYGMQNFKERFKISVRQLEIIQMTIDGLSNEEISKNLSLSRRTVEAHLLHIYNKLSVQNKIEMVRLANKFNFTAKMPE